MTELKLPGKLPGDPNFTNVYYDTSQVAGDMRGPWNQGEQWNYVSEREKHLGVGGGDGSASVQLSPEERKAVDQFAARTASNLNSNPTTGADLGSAGKKPDQPTNPSS